MQQNGDSDHIFDWKLWGLASLLLVGFVGLALWFPLLGHVETLPLADVRTFAPTLYNGLAYALIVCTLFAIYGFAYRLLLQSARPAPAWSIFLATLFFAVPLFVTYPINAVDVYRYFFEGRMMVEYGANPLVAPPATFGQDPLLPFAAILLQQSSPYGPLWEIAGAGVYWLSSGSILGSLLLFKLIGAACHLLTGLVIWQILDGQAARTRSAQLLLWLWNPALLFMFVMDAHNDILMLLFLVLGYKYIARRQPVLGLIILVLAPLIKPIGVLAIPFFAIEVWQQIQDGRQRLSTFLLAGSGALIIAFVAFLPFGSPLPLVQRLVDESQNGPSFSPTQFVFDMTGLLGVSVPIPLIAKGGSLLLGLSVLILLWLTWRGRSSLKGVADSFAAYLVTALKFRIWYPSWLFPWLVLDVESPYRLLAGILLLLFSQLSVILYSHIRIAWLEGNSVYAHVIGEPLVFGLPLLLAYILKRINHSRQKHVTPSNF